MISVLASPMLRGAERASDAHFSCTNHAPQCSCCNERNKQSVSGVQTEYNFYLRGLYNAHALDLRLSRSIVRDYIDEMILASSLDSPEDVFQDVGLEGRGGSATCNTRSKNTATIHL